MKVEDYMSRDVISVKEDDSLLMARNTMKKHQIRQTPVLNEEGRMTGFITYSNILGYCPSQAIPVNFWEMVDIIAKKKVRDAMTVIPPIVTPDMPIEDAATLIREEKLDALPVVNNGKLEGIITGTDIINGFTDLMRVLRKESYDFSKLHQIKH